MITQETKTFIQVETEYYFHENGLYIDPMLLVYPLVKRFIQIKNLQKWQV